MLGTEPEVKETYIRTGQVRLIFHDILDHGNSSLQASQAAMCAGEQGQYWAFHDLLFAEQGRLFGGNTLQTTKDLAVELGTLDTAAFNTCMDEQRYAAIVQSNNEQRRAIGVRTRPTFDINGVFLAGAQPFTVLQATIDPLLNN